MKLSKDLMRFFLIPVVLLAGIFLTFFFTIYYTTTGRTADGKTFYTNWPRIFTANFSQYVDFENEIPVIDEEGLNQIQNHDLWFQMIDESGQEIMEVGKPDDVNDQYTPAELLALYQDGTEQYSVFLNTVTEGTNSYTYMIGFPMSVSKVVMYIDSARYQSGKTLIVLTILLTALFVLGLTIVYNTVILRNLKRIQGALHDIAARNYQANSKHRFLKEIYHGMDQLNEELAENDRLQALDEQAQEEWLANITHDLKTPLAPIRGYAELLAEPETEQSAVEIKRYGETILKNVLYTEQLVDDLKMTYQLKNNMLPLNREPHSISRFAREVVIDVLNTPEYEDRAISLETDDEDRNIVFDSDLLRRALTNILVNALKHTHKNVEIFVTIVSDYEKGFSEGTQIVVKDCGSGMTPQELAGLFKRYYRGTSTDVKSEGSGLGMAIAKQIVEAHGGRIDAESIQEEGTTITIRIPENAAGKMDRT